LAWIAIVLPSFSFQAIVTAPKLGPVHGSVSSSTMMRARGSVMS
jgi:hypothetical protein